MKTFKAFISEASLKQEAGIKYGKILFGDLMHLPEKDTKTENSLIALLSNFLINNIQTPKLVNAFKNLQKYKTVFKDELQAHNTGLVYRGFDQSGDKVDNVVTKAAKFEIVSPLTKSKGHYVIKIEMNGFAEVVHGKTFLRKTSLTSDRWLRMPSKFKYVPELPIQSWTDNKHSSFFDTHGVVTINAMKINHNEFIFDSAFLEKVHKRLRSGFKDEHEVIRVSKKSIPVDLWVLVDRDDFVSQNASNDVTMVLTQKLWNYAEHHIANFKNQNEISEYDIVAAKDNKSGTGFIFTFSAEII